MIPFLTTIFVLVTAFFGVAGYARHRWRRATEALHRELDVHRRRGEPASVDLRSVDTLPPVVQRYFRAALTDGQPMIETFTADQVGDFNMRDRGSDWRPLVATQRVVTRERGFVWDARVSVAPGLAAFVWDAYVAGRGVLVGKLLGLWTVVHADGDDLAEGELLRFLAEAPWYPTALLPTQGVQWAPVGSASARASIEDRGFGSSIVFEFGEDGLPESFFVEARGRLLDGVSVPTRWEGVYRNYERHAGMMVPLEAEVRWAPRDQPVLPYFRGHLTRLEYSPAG